MKYRKHALLTMVLIGAFRKMFCEEPGFPVECPPIPLRGLGNKISDILVRYLVTNGQIHVQSLLITEMTGVGGGRFKEPGFPEGRPPIPLRTLENSSSNMLVTK